MGWRPLMVAVAVCTGGLGIGFMDGSFTSDNL